MENDKAKNFTESFRLLDTELPNSSIIYEKYYTDRGNTEKIKELLGQINLRNTPMPVYGEEVETRNSKIMFSGQRGSGKTTELHTIEHSLEKSNFFVIFIDSRHDGLNFLDLHYADLLAVLFIKSIDNIPDEIGSLDQELQRRIEMITIDILGISYSNDELKNNKFKTKGVLEKFGGQFRNKKLTKEESREKITENADEIISTFNSVICYIETIKKKKILFIIDDLEKVTNLEKIEQVFIKDKNVIGCLDCNMIFTIPPSLKFSESFSKMLNIYEDEFFLPVFEIYYKNGKVNHNQLKEMIKIIKKRIPEKLMKDEVIKLAALYSGGITSDMMKLCAKACNKAEARNAPSITTELIYESFSQLKENTMPAISSRQKEDLQKVHSFKQIDNIKEAVNFLFTAKIIAYRDKDGNAWYDTNPILWTYDELNELKNKI